MFCFMAYNSWKHIYEIFKIIWFAEASSGTNVQFIPLHHHSSIRIKDIKMKVTMFMGTKINVSTKACQKTNKDNVPVYCLRLSYNCLSWLEGFTMLYLINHPQIKGEQNVAVYKLFKCIFGFFFFFKIFFFFLGGGMIYWFLREKTKLMHPNQSYKLNACRC